MIKRNWKRIIASLILIVMFFPHVNSLAYIDQSAAGEYIEHSGPVCETRRAAAIRHLHFGAGGKRGNGGAVSAVPSGVFNRTPATAGTLSQKRMRYAGADTGRI